jgi:hypothetical protein
MAYHEDNPEHTANLIGDLIGDIRGRWELLQRLTKYWNESTISLTTRDEIRKSMQQWVNEEMRTLTADTYEVDNMLKIKGLPPISNDGEGM